MSILKKIMLLGLFIDGIAIIASLPVMTEDLSLHAESEHLFLIWFVLFLNIVAWFMLFYVYSRIDTLEKIRKLLGKD